MELIGCRFREERQKQILTQLQVFFKQTKSQHPEGVVVQRIGNADPRESLRGTFHLLSFLHLPKNTHSMYPRNHVRMAAGDMTAGQK